MLFLSQPPLTVSLILIDAVPVKLGPRAGVVHQSVGVVVCLAKLAFAPVWISARLKRPLSLVKEKVIRAVRAYYEVFRSVISPVPVHMVNLFGIAQFASQRPLCDQDVLIDLTVGSGSRMVEAAFQDVAHSGAGGTATPIRVLLSFTSPAMSTAKPQRVALADSPTSAVVRPCGNRGRSAATTLAEPGRI